MAYDAGYMAGVFDSIMADAQHIIEKAAAAKEWMRASSRNEGTSAQAAPPQPGGPLFNVPARRDAVLLKTAVDKAPWGGQREGAA